MESGISFNQSKYESKNPFKRMALDFFYQAIVEMPFEAETVLDAGCGEGFGANRLLEKFPGLDILGTDLSWPALVNAKQISSDLETLQADVTRLPFSEKQFDMIVSLEVLEHLPEPAQAVQAYKRTAARYLLLSVPNEPVFRTLRMLEGNDILQWGDHPEHINHWNFISFPRFLKKQGLRVIARKVPFPYTWVIVLCELLPDNQGE
jgi:2-polyprenyl-3-methyl-5-hydroxy-6-metoxy-1,4-benzoquinol methylase